MSGRCRVESWFYVFVTISVLFSVCSLAATYHARFVISFGFTLVASLSCLACLFLLVRHSGGCERCVVREELPGNGEC